MKLNIKRGKSNRFGKKLSTKKENKKTTNIRDIVDLTRDFSIMFSGVEDKNNLELLYNIGVRDFLVSYHYMQKKHIEASYYKDKQIEFFVDSGAFTFMSSLEHQNWTVEQWEKQIQSYLKWVRKNKDIVFAIANLDLEYLVGGKQVQEWNEQYFEPFMIETGIPVCFVYHDNGTLLSWEQYCQRYPYVGISWGGIDSRGNDFQYGFERLQIAERYNTVVHGMAMTNTSLLAKLPFYTVDSTTWLVGSRYGDLDYWNGKKMNRLTKEKWKGVFLDKIVALGFDRQKLLDEDAEEMMKVNVKAHLMAEEALKIRLKPLMYWKKARVNRRTTIEGIRFPSPDYLSTITPNSEGLSDYARELNINPEADKEFLRNLVLDVTCFTHFEDEDYKEVIQKEYNEENINGIHSIWINQIRNTTEEKIEDLKKFFLSNVLGETDVLLQYGTNFDRKTKERDEYITDEEYERLDVPDLEIENLAAKFLPLKSKDNENPMDEISKLDDDIFEENGIIPVRDEKGRFLKGQREVLKPKTLYSNKFPKLSCTTCVNAQKCPEYKEGYVCAFNKMFDRYDTRNMDDVIQGMQGIADLAMIRLQRAMITETMNGGIPDPAVSQLMNQTMNLYSGIQRMYQNRNYEVVKQTQVLRNDGTRETVTSVSTNPQGGGILEKLFGDLGKQEVVNEVEVDAEIKETS